jgi:general secretion pathway protein G
MWKKIVITALALAALVVLTNLLLLPRREVNAAREAVLRQDLFVLRGQINHYTADLHRRPQSLEELEVAGYIQQIPTDPMTGRSDTWVVDLSRETKVPGIKGIHSGSSAYHDW